MRWKSPPKAGIGSRWIKRLQGTLQRPISVSGCFSRPRIKSPGDGYKHLHSFRILQCVVSDRCNDVRVWILYRIDVDIWDRFDTIPGHQCVWNGDVSSACRGSKESSLADWKIQVLRISLDFQMVLIIPHAIINAFTTMLGWITPASFLLPCPDQNSITRYFALISPHSPHFAKWFIVDSIIAASSLMRSAIRKG